LPNAAASHCRLENNGFEPDLPKAQATALFRIFQETLTNVMRHAQASEVVVRLEKRGDELYLQVADNGRGITSGRNQCPGRVRVTGHSGTALPFRRAGWSLMGGPATGPV
jgi:two-component system sensor histidine kinase UhpB